MNELGPHLEKYLLEGKVGHFDVPLEQDILEHDGLVSDIALAWGTFPDAIRAVIQARINSIEARIARHASPYDVLALREAVSQLDLLISDFVKYTEELERRKKKEGSPPETQEEDATS
jgi:short subunit dehydrogenase-like uncharacterized protein